MTDQEYLDRCAIEAMKVVIKVTNPGSGWVEMVAQKHTGKGHFERVADHSYSIASAMLAERKKRMVEEPTNTIY